MSIFNNPNRIPEDYGLRTAGGLIAYFVLMKVFNLAHIVELRFLNLAVLIFGVYYALKKFKNTHEEHMNYFRGLITGIATAAIGSVLFAVFLFIYMKLDVGMWNAIVENEPMGRHLNPYMAAFIVALEGLFSGFLATFVLLNYVDTDDVNDH